MYYQNYEDYMRSVLGYPIESQNTYETYNNQSIMPYEDMYSSNRNNYYNNEMVDLYPEIYRIVNPMVNKICEINTKQITPELIEQMTDEIYVNLESQPDFDTVINVKVNTKTSIEKDSRTSSDTSKVASSSSSTKSKSDVERLDTRNSREGISSKESEESRQRRPNNTLRDLIKILILNRLFGGGFPNRPPRPPMPPPRPPRPPMRPPFPRNDSYYEEYPKF